jgi:ribosomal protein S18 acetylase RimI-like enzyme
MLRLFDSIRKRSVGLLDPSPSPPSRHPCTLDYTYFYPSQRDQAQDLLQSQFWPGIDLGAELDTPWQGIIASYGQRVVGALFYDTSRSYHTAYITHICVAPGWQGCGIGKHLLHLAITAGSDVRWRVHADWVAGKDWLLHCMPANASAVSLYNRMGFKSEALVVGFYDGYANYSFMGRSGHALSPGRRNALFMRLRQY